MSERLEGTALDDKRKAVNFRDCEDKDPDSCHNCLNYNECKFKGHRGCVCDLWVDEEQKITVSRVKLQGALDKSLINPVIKAKFHWIDEGKIIILERILRGDFS